MTTKNGEIVKVELELHNFKNLKEFLNCNVDVDAQMSVERWKYSFTSDVPCEVTVEDLGISKGDITFSSGNNSWVDTKYVNKFGLEQRMMVNTKTFDVMPWTVWSEGENKHYPKWCGVLFETEEEAQAWIDEQEEF